MSELTHNPGPDSPGGSATPNTGNPLASSGAQQLQDGGALENDGSQWGPKHPPKTDAADNSAAEQTGEGPDANTPMAADTPDLNPTGGEEPQISGDGRASSA